VARAVADVPDIRSGDTGVVAYVHDIANPGVRSPAG
jgi:hypothetical protein